MGVLAGDNFEAGGNIHNQCPWASISHRFPPPPPPSSSADNDWHNVSAFALRNGCALRNQEGLGGGGGGGVSAAFPTYSAVVIWPAGDVELCTARPPDAKGAELVALRGLSESSDLGVSGLQATSQFSHEGGSLSDSLVSSSVECSHAVPRTQLLYSLQYFDKSPGRFHPAATRASAAAAAADLQSSAKLRRGGFSESVFKCLFLCGKRKTQTQT